MLTQPEKRIGGQIHKALVTLHAAWAAFEKVQEQVREAQWIDYGLVWDDDAQNYFLAEWHDFLIALGLNPDTDRHKCLDLLFKRVNRVREEKNQAKRVINGGIDSDIGLDIFK